MTDQLFAALEALAPATIKFYAFVDERGQVVASGTSTVLPYTQQYEIDLASHELCLKLGPSMLTYNNNKLSVKQAELDAKISLCYFNYPTVDPAVRISINQQTIQAELTSKGKQQLSAYAAKGKITNKIWILDANARHNCIAELLLTNSCYVSQQTVSNIPAHIVAATYPLFSSYSLEINNGKI